MEGGRGCGERASEAPQLPVAAPRQVLRQRAGAPEKKRARRDAETHPPAPSMKKMLWICGVSKGWVGGELGGEMVADASIGQLQLRCARQAGAGVMRTNHSSRPSHTAAQGAEGSSKRGGWRWDGL